MSRVSGNWFARTGAVWRRKHDAARRSHGGRRGLVTLADLCKPCNLLCCLCDWGDDAEKMERMKSKQGARAEIQE